MSEPTVPPGPPPVAPPPPPPPPSGGAAGGASPNRGLMLVLCYLWLLAIVPLLVEKDDKEVQWHAKHGLVLLVAEIIAGIALGILQVIIGHFALACAGCVVGWVFWFAILILHILCIVKAVNGQRLIIPGVSLYADRF